jgi:membrane-bound lytic murein transglycosylase B
MLIAPRCSSLARAAMMIVIGLAAFVVQAKPVRLGEYSKRPETAELIGELVREHGFSARQLRVLFTQVKREPLVLDAISRPVVAPPKWHEYRGQFVTPARIAGGLTYWQRNLVTLERAEAQYGVPAEVIVAIIGVETFYGRNTGRYRVIDALATLAFDYPRRAEFFRRELMQFLLLAREQRISPLAPEGSYAGAMGLPQFMPSSYRRYAVDFNRDGKVNIWNDGPDVIGSVAHFLLEHGWAAGEPALVSVGVAGQSAPAELDRGLSSRRALRSWMELGVSIVDAGLIETDPMGMLVMLEGADGEEYRFAMQNFQVLMRYNRSRLYASAVWDLAQALREARAAP